MLRLVISPNVVALLNVDDLQLLFSDSEDFCPRRWLLKSCANTLSDSLAIGSCQGAPKSRASESALSLTSCCLNSRRSFESAAPAIAARLSEPSGAFTILTGLRSSVRLV